MESNSSSDDISEGTKTSDVIELARVDEAKTTSKKNVLYWAFYDAADTVFAMAIISITLFQWGELAGMKEGFSFYNAHLMVSTFLMISNVLVAILMPIFGAHSDIIGRRKPIVLIFASLTIILTPLIVITRKFVLGLVIFTIANICYQAANLYYESMLPYISDTKSRAKVSAFGVAFGYLGTIVSVVLIFVLPILFGEATDADDVMKYFVSREFIELNWVFWMFIFAAIFYLLLAIPFFFTKERAAKLEKRENLGKVIRSSFVQLGRTTKEIFKENRNMVIFIFSWFLINDAIGTAIAVLVDYLREGLGFQERIAGVILIIGIIIGIGFLYLMGPTIDKRGPKFGLVITAIAWGLGIILIVLAGINSKIRFFVYIGSIFLSFGMGSVFIVGRQFILELSPPNKIGQYMGFKKISGKASAALGPLIFSSILASGKLLGKTIAYQLAISSLLGFFAIGVVIGLFIKNYHPLYIKGQRFPYTDEKIENEDVKDNV